MSGNLSATSLLRRYRVLAIDYFKLYFGLVLHAKTLAVTKHQHHFPPTN